MITRDLVTGWLCDCDGRVITNMPYGEVPENHAYPPEYPGETFAERIGKEVERRCGKPWEEVADRIELIEPEMLEAWTEDHQVPRGMKPDNFIRSPLLDFRERDLTGTLIILDEAHNFCATEHSRPKKLVWKKFCGEIRHMTGGTGGIQFITQSPGKLAKQIIDEAGLRQALVDAEEERDPFFGIKLFYWYELRAKIVGEYSSAFVRVDIRDIDGKKTKHSNHQRVKREQWVFRLYDSYNAPVSGGKAAGASAAKRDWETRAWPSFLWWFVRKNGFNFVKPLTFCIIGLVLLTQGQALFGYFIGRITRAADKRPKVQAVAGVPTRTAAREAAAATPPRARATEQGSAVPSTEPTQREVGYQNDPALVQELNAARERERLAGVLRVLTPESATFADGIVYETGEVIFNGVHKGKSIDSIEWASRSVLLDDGERVFLGDWLRKVADAEAATLAPSLQGGAGTNADTTSF